MRLRKCFWVCFSRRKEKKKMSWMRADCGTSENDVPSLYDLFAMVVQRIEQLGRVQHDPRIWLRIPHNVAIWRLDVEYVLKWQPELREDDVRRWRSSPCQLPTAMTELYATPFHRSTTGRDEGGISWWNFATQEILRFRDQYLDNVRAHGTWNEAAGDGLVDTCVLQILYPARDASEGRYGTGCGLYVDEEETRAYLEPEVWDSDRQEWQRLMSYAPAAPLQQPFLPMTELSEAVAAVKNGQ
jgi:hypothetical protein